MSQHNTPEKLAKHREAMREHRRKHPEACRAAIDKWRKANPEKYREIIRRYKKTPRIMELRYRTKLDRNHRSIVFARRARRWWTWTDIVAIFDASRTDREISKVIGRSIVAIEVARVRYVDRAPIGWTPKGSKRK